MERLAYKTEQETVSMHVITCVTLAYLPGTFVAVSLSRSLTRGLARALTSRQSFFQSGLLQWQAAATTEETSMYFNSHGFVLFSEITFPLMAATFVIWWLFYRWLEKRARRKAEEWEA